MVEKETPRVTAISLMFGFFEALTILTNDATSPGVTTPRGFRPRRSLLTGSWAIGSSETGSSEIWLDPSELSSSLGVDEDVDALIDK